MRRLIKTALMVVASSALATDHYIDSGATGANNGTSWADAWDEFDQVTWGGVSAADTIWVSSGTYTTGLSIGASGSSANPITISVSGEVGHSGAITQNPGLAEQGIHFDDYSFVTVQGSNVWTITNAQFGVYTGNGSGGTNKVRGLRIIDCGDSTDEHGVFIRSAKGHSGWEVSGCTILDPYQDCIQVLRAADPSWDACIISNNYLATTVVGWGDDGVQCAGTGMTIVGNTISNLHDHGHADGVQTSGQSIQYFQAIGNYIQDIGNAPLFIDPIGSNVTNSNIRIYNNVLALTLTNAFTASRGIQIYADNTDTGVTQHWQNVYIGNNTVADFPLPGIWYRSKGAIMVMSNVTNINNLVVNCGWDGGYNAADFDGVEITYGSGMVLSNLYVAAGEDGVSTVGWGGTNYSSTATLNAAPGAGGCVLDTDTTIDWFTGYSAYTASDGSDFKLNSNAPVVDTGSVGVFATDFLWLARPSGSAWDIGAYEFRAGGWPEVPDNPPNRIWIGVP